jgi:hypothetical protein
VGRDCHGFYRGIAEDLVRIRFHLGNHGSTEQGGSLYTGQDHLLWTSTSKVVYVEDSLFAWSAEEDVSDRGTQFTSRFWERLHETLDTQLRFSSAYHPQADGQTRRVNQILEYMLRACALQYGRIWHKSLS